MTTEELLIYGFIFLLSLGIFVFYWRNQTNKSRKVEAKIAQAKVEGVHEPVSLYPYIDPDICIGSGACVAACPEKDILGIVNGRAELVNASNCVGHGACFHACPVEAISLKIGTEKRGVELPHVNQHFETNVSGIFIAGELGGMGLIKNSVEQGKQAVDYLKATLRQHQAEYDLLIVGAGPAGISAALQAKKYGLKSIVLEQDSLGGTVFNFPRAKVVMTAPMDLPLYGKIKLYETRKVELLQLWERAIRDNEIVVVENTKVDAIQKEGENFRIVANQDQQYLVNKVLLAIGRRGSPRKLNVAGEQLEKVAYRLLEPELIAQKNVLVVGGGDSAIESALLLAPQNNVTLSYRAEAFNRLKPKNLANIKEAIEKQLLNVAFNSTVQEITEKEVSLLIGSEKLTLPNDLVYIFAGGELPTEFLKKSGINITKRFGHVLKSHPNR